MTERGEISPREAVFWFNSTPQSGQDDISVLQQQVYTYEWRNPLRVPKTEESELPCTIR